MYHVVLHTNTHSISISMFPVQTFMVSSKWSPPHCSMPAWDDFSLFVCLCLLLLFVCYVCVRCSCFLFWDDDEGVGVNKGGGKTNFQVPVVSVMFENGCFLFPLFVPPPFRSPEPGSNRCRS